MASPLIETGFDRYQRFRHAAQLIDQLAGPQGLSVLDIGPFDQAFTDFLPGHRVRPYEETVRSGFPLALEDGAVDVAAALDVLEHIPPDERAFFISELARVSKLGAVLSFPAAQARAAEAFVLQMTGSPWLKEHKQYGLPQPGEIEGMFAAMGLSFARHPNAAIPSWTAMMLLMYGTEPDTRAKISAFFNEHYYELENREPAYRYIYVLRKK